MYTSDSECCISDRVCIQVIVSVCARDTERVCCIGDDETTVPVFTGISHRTNAPSLLPSFTLAPRPLMLAENDWMHWKFRMSHILMIPD